MTFNEYEARQMLYKMEDNKLALVREQRHLAAEIVAGHLHQGFKMTGQEVDLVWRCQKATRPVDKSTLAVLKILNTRRWAEKG